MSVLVEAISVIVQIETLKAKYPVDDQVEHVAMIWGPDLLSQAN